MPCSAQPPTPSKTPNVDPLANQASSPPVATLSGCGSTTAAPRRLQSWPTSEPTAPAAPLTATTSDPFGRGNSVLAWNRELKKHIGVGAWDNGYEDNRIFNNGLSDEAGAGANVGFAAKVGLAPVADEVAKPEVLEILRSCYPFPTTPRGDASPARTRGSSTGPRPWSA